MSATSLTRMRTLPVLPADPPCTGHGMIFDYIALAVESGGRNEIDRAVKTAAPFCDACPERIAKSCLNLAMDDGYTGVAGGVPLRNGKPIKRGSAQ